MVGRGGGKRICSRSIAPGKLMSCVQASRMQLFSKQNVADHFNNSTIPQITDEIAHVDSKNLERQRTAYKDQINKATPIELPATESPTTDTPIHGDDIQGYEETTTPILNDQASEGVINLMDESIHGKRKKRSNFVSRIEVGLQVNESLDPQPRQIITRNEVEQANGDEIDSNTATSKIKGRGKRGMYKSYVVDMKIKGRGSKLKIIIPDDIDRAIGDNARHLVNECGRVVRKYSQKSRHVRGKGTGVRAYSKEKAQIEQRKIVEQQQEKIQEQQQQIKELMESQLKS